MKMAEGRERVIEEAYLINVEKTGRREKARHIDR
jgi:hypothetical protein